MRLIYGKYVSHAVDLKENLYGPNQKKYVNNSQITIDIHNKYSIKH